MHCVLILYQLLQEILAWQRRTMAMMHQRVAAGESCFKNNLLMKIKQIFVSCFSALRKVGSQSNPSNYLVFLCLANRYSSILAIYVQMTRHFFTLRKELIFSSFVHAFPPCISTLCTSHCSLREVNCLRILEISLPNSNAALLEYSSSVQRVLGWQAWGPGDSIARQEGSAPVDLPYRKFEADKPEDQEILSPDRKAALLLIFRTESLRLTRLRTRRFHRQTGRHRSCSSSVKKLWGWQAWVLGDSIARQEGSAPVVLP